MILKSKSALSELTPRHWGQSLNVHNRVGKQALLACYEFVQQARSDIELRFCLQIAEKSKDLGANQE